MAAQLTRTIGPAAAAAQLVNLRCEQLLAGAGLAEEQDRRVGFGHLAHLLLHPANRSALPDDGRRAERTLDFAAQVHVLRVQLIAKALHLGERPAERLVAVPAGEHAGEHARHEAHALKNLGRPPPLSARHREGQDADDPPRHRQRDGDGRLHVEAKQARPVDPVRQLVGTREAHQLAGPERLEHPREAFPGRHACGQRRNLGTPPAVGREQIAVIAELEQCAPVEIERLDDAALSLLIAASTLGSGQIDEPHRQFADEVLEIQPLPVRRADRHDPAARVRECRRSRRARRARRESRRRRSQTSGTWPFVTTSLTLTCWRCAHGRRHRSDSG